MVRLIFDCNCYTCDGGTPAGRDANGHILFGGSHCVCYCHKENNSQTKISFWQDLDRVYQGHPVITVLFGAKVIKACFVIMALNFGLLMGMGEITKTDIFPMLFIFATAYFLDNLKVIISKDIKHE